MNGRGHRLLDALGGGLGPHHGGVHVTGRFPLEVRDQHQELVAAAPCDQVGLTGRFAQAVGHHPQELVAAA